MDGRSSLYDLHRFHLTEEDAHFVYWKGKVKDKTCLDGFSWTWSRTINVKIALDGRKVVESIERCDERSEGNRKRKNNSKWDFGWRNILNAVTALICFMLQIISTSHWYSMGLSTEMVYWWDASTLTYEHHISSHRTAQWSVKDILPISWWTTSPLEDRFLAYLS